MKYQFSSVIRSVMPLTQLEISIIILLPITLFIYLEPYKSKFQTIPLEEFIYYFFIILVIILTKDITRKLIYKNSGREIISQGHYILRFYENHFEILGLEEKIGYDKITDVRDYHLGGNHYEIIIEYESIKDKRQIDLLTTQTKEGFSIFQLRDFFYLTGPEKVDKKVYDEMLEFLHKKATHRKIITQD